MMRFQRALVGPVILLLILGPAAVVGRGPARAQTAGCTQPTGQEPSGPTDISAVSGNQELTVAFNPDATITAFKWPSPSYYDQIKYRTTDRSEPFMGAQPNEGSFIGLAWKPRSEGTGWEFAWLREWNSKQRFTDDDTDEVVTTFTNAKHGIKAKVADVVAEDSATMQRDITISRTRSSAVNRIRIFAFANFNPVFSKLRNQPVADWCTEESNDSGATFIRKNHAVVHARSGPDQSTGENSSVAVAFGFDERSGGHEVGDDTYEAGAAGQSAYDDAVDGTLSGSPSASGQADAALFIERKLKFKRSTRARVVMAAADTQEAALKAFRKTAGRSLQQVRTAKRDWWSDWLQGAALPKDAPAVVTRLSKRALISVRQATDPSSGLIATSIGTQPPLALDWVRHGAYINQALEVAGHPEMVLKHNQRYASLQATTVSKPLGGETTPTSNWSQNYYGDGVVGGTIPYEIDATGFGIWALYEHALFEDSDYLNTALIYEAIQRAAHYLTDLPPSGCRDLATGLQCTANEEDNPNPSQTLVGAQAAWLGLGAAVEAAIDRDTPDSIVNAEKWQARRDELKAAIDANFFNEECTCYTNDYETGGTLLWPVGLLEPSSDAAQAQAEINFEHMDAAMNGVDTAGGMEARALLGNAHVWSTALDIARLREALVWIARNTTTEGTGLLGSAWMLYPPGSDDAQIIAMEGQPHNFHGAMYYLAALEAYGVER